MGLQPFRLGETDRRGRERCQARGTTANDGGAFEEVEDAEAEGLEAHALSLSIRLPPRA